MLDKLFGWGKKKGEAAPAPAIHFGRYSDNNKSLTKTNRWTDADNLFKDKKFGESLDAFFDYLRDDATANVVYERNGSEGRFHLYQGSKIVRGQFTATALKAEVSLARMPQPSVPVMRRLLEMNFNLYYSRFAMDEDRLCMRFDTERTGASPSKLYYSLKELATKGDKQDDLLVQDFTVLETADSEHVTEISTTEKEIKYQYLQQWIKEALDAIGVVDPDKFSGGNAYLLLALIYKIDYLITPEGKMLNDLEKIAGIYFKKDDRPVIEKNRDMVTEFQKMTALPKEEVFKNLFSAKYTFSIVAPQPYKTIAEAIHAANQNMAWYKDNNHLFFAKNICEYGISYCQYSYSLPRVITEFFHLYMMVTHADYFNALGFGAPYYNPITNQFDNEAIIKKIKTVQSNWKEKYPLMDFKTENLRFDTMVNFCWTFTNELEFLNMEPK